MICFYLSDNAAASLAIPGGEQPDDLHLTLAYLGDFRQYGPMAAAEILTCVQDMARWSAPLAGEISGSGRFTGEGGLDVFYASVDIPGLAEFRTDLVRRLANRGTPIQTEHGFDPHITLAYIPADGVTPTFNFDKLALRFDTIFVVFGDEEVSIPLTGISSPSEAGRYHEIVDLCRDNGGALRLFFECPQLFSAPPPHINFLPKPGVYTHPEYGQMTFTKERNQRFVDNFIAKLYQEKLPIDCEHDLQASGAVGWITMLRVNDDGSVDADCEWNDRGRALIEGDRFKYFSPAWFENWTEPVSTNVYRDIAIGGAICRRPFFKEGSLRPLVSSESGLRLADKAVTASDASADGHLEIFFTTLKPETAEASNSTDDEGVAMSTAIKFDKNNPPKTLAEALAMLASQSDQLTAAETLVTSATSKVIALCDKTKPPKDLDEGIAQVTEKLATAEAASTAGQRTASEESRQAAETIRTLTERVGTMEKANRKLRFTEIVRQFTGEREGHIDMLEFLYAADPEKGEEGERFKKYVERERATAERLRISGLFEEAGSNAPAAGSASAQLQTLAEKRAAESAGKLTVEQAMVQVATENPELYKAQREGASA
jgi:2'-5' RNA ligase